MGRDVRGMKEEPRESTFRLAAPDASRETGKWSPSGLPSAQDHDKFPHPSSFFSKAVETSRLDLWHRQSLFPPSVFHGSILPKQHAQTYH